MKKENFIFLILLILAAIFCGSTLAIATNYSYLAQNAKQLQVAEAHAASSQAESIAADLRQDNSPVSSETSQPQSAAAGQSLSDSGQNNDEMDITPAEKQQIEDMLTSLDQNQGSDYTQLLTDFQAKHSLNPTGCLDTQTLNAIIRAVAITKASNAVRT